jgi:hypothetical protein
LFAPFSAAEREAEVAVPAFAGDAYEECNVILRYVNLQMLRRFDAMVVHAGALVYRGKAWLFTAPPGTGKSTHLRLWLETMGEEARILNGDKPFLRLTEQGLTVYGSPWQGKENYGFPGAYPLGGIYLLRRGTENAVAPLSANEALMPLLDATFFAELGMERVKVLELFNAACARVPVAELRCTISHRAVDAVRLHMEQGGMV